MKVPCIDLRLKFSVLLNGLEPFKIQLFLFESNVRLKPMYMTQAAHFSV